MVGENKNTVHLGIANTEEENQPANHEKLSGGRIKKDNPRFEKRMNKEPKRESQPFIIAIKGKKNTNHHPKKEETPKTLYHQFIRRKNKTLVL